jgi:hypothetical protein
MRGEGEIQSIAQQDGDEELDPFCAIRKHGSNSTQKNGLDTF